MAFQIVAEIVCVFLMFLLWFLSLIPLRIAQKEQTEGYDNTNPRAQYQRLGEKGQKAKAIVDNTFEGLVFFSTAVIFNLFARFANPDVSGVPPGVFCIIYVATRVVYPYLYFKDFATARSSVWFLGFLCILAIWIHTLVEISNL